MRLRDALDRMRVSASVAGGAVTAELFDNDHVDLSFVPGYYGRVDEPALEENLVSLARLMYADYLRQYFRAVSAAFEQAVTKDPPAIGWRDKEYVDRRQELVAEGGSADNRITVTVRWMCSWRVRIAPGTLRMLDERRFSTGFGEAAQALIRDQFAGIRALKNHVYG
jgi:hypothetical protein